MRKMTALISRNRKLFFRDRGMFLSSLITPVILIVLYATFLANVYKDSFLSALPDTVQISEKLINRTVAAQLAAALLSVSCITVTFCVNLTMVQDLANGARKDFNVSPVKKSVIFLGYFLSTLLNSLMVNGLALVVCLIYMCKMGWYMSVTDVLWVILDEILLVLFGCALSSIICYPLKTQGADVGSRNDRECRLWIYMRCVYANLQFRHRTAESIVNSAGHLRNFFAEKPYAAWNL